MFEDTDICGKTIKKSKDHTTFETGSQENRRRKGLKETLREIVLVWMLLFLQLYTRLTGAYFITYIHVTTFLVCIKYFIVKFQKHMNQ